MSGFEDNSEGVSIINSKGVKESTNALTSLIKESEFLGLTLTKLSSERLLAEVKSLSPISRISYLEKSDEITSRYEDELESKKLFYIFPENLKYYENARKMFGEQVELAFPSIISEIEEAGKCLAFQRCTASVFHLMRIMEAGLKLLAKDKAIGIPYAPSWESYLTQINAKLAEKYKSKSKKWKAVEPFFKEAAAHLSAVKIAWRNPTMHIVRSYTFDEAESAFQSVKTFMQHLATRLKE